MSQTSEVRHQKSVLTADRRPLISGVLLAALLVASCAGPRSFRVGAAPPRKPLITVSPTVVNFSGARPAPQRVQVTTSNGADWDGIVDQSRWFVAVPKDGASGAWTMLTAHTDGLRAGRYSGNITFSSPGLPNKVVVVNLTVPAFPPPPPPDVTPTPIGWRPDRVTLGWNRNADEVDGYRLYFGTTSRAGSYVYQYPHGQDAGDKTWITVRGLRETTYFFSAVAYLTFGEESAEESVMESPYSDELRIRWNGKRWVGTIINPSEGE